MSDLVQAAHPRFRELVAPHARAEGLFDGGTWLEGPLWLPGRGELLFSDIPRDRVLAWSAAVVRESSRGGFQNGRTLDGQGRIVACEHGGRRLVRLRADGTPEPLATHHAGGRLNSPNDVVARPDGSLWFTDPDYGILSDHEGHAAPSEQPACHVFRLAPGGAEPQPMVADMVRPNGLAFSADGQWLYVADSGASHTPGVPAEIRRFRVGADGSSLQPAGVLAVLDCGLPDGMAVDAHGHVWSSAGDGVHCFAPDGRLLGRLRLGCVTSNLCFGGPQGRDLFITSARRLWRVPVAVAGAPLVR